MDLLKITKENIAGTGNNIVHLCTLFYLHVHYDVETNQNFSIRGYHVVSRASQRQESGERSEEGAGDQP